MREIIMTGKTVEQATELACEAMGLPREEISIEILEMPQRKLFKFIPAKVKATAESADEKKPEEEKPLAAQKAAQVEKPKQQKSEKPAESQKNYSNESAKPVDLSADEKAKTAADFLEDICTKMGINGAKVSAEKRGEALILKVDGPDVGALIGRRGETMEALSYLCSLAANRIGGDYVKIGLDVGGYREKREGDLETLARKVCDKVKKTNRAQMLEPMNPYERRIIHSTVSEIEGVRSESTGEGITRRVVVLSTAQDARNERPDRYDKSSPPRGPRTGGGFKGGPKPRFNKDSGPRGPRRPSSTPARNFENREKTGAAPTAPSRSESVKDGENMPLYGKIEL